MLVAACEFDPAPVFQALLAMPEKFEKALSEALLSPLS